MSFAFAGFFIHWCLPQRSIGLLHMMGMVCWLSAIYLYKIKISSYIYFDLFWVIFLLCKQVFYSQLISGRLILSHHQIFFLPKTWLICASCPGQSREKLETWTRKWEQWSGTGKDMKHAKEIRTAMKCSHGQSKFLFQWSVWAAWGVTMRMKRPRDIVLEHADGGVWGHTQPVQPPTTVLWVCSSETSKCCPKKEKRFV